MATAQGRGPAGYSPWVSLGKTEMPRELCCKEKGLGQLLALLHLALEEDGWSCYLEEGIHCRRWVPAQSCFSAGESTH